MAIADKLAYLGDTKQLLRQSLEGVGEYITEDTPFRAYAAKLANTQRTLGLNFDGDQYDYLNPINAQGFSDLLTFSQGTEGTYYNLQGVLSTASVDEERLTHDPASLNSSTDTFDISELAKNDVVTINLVSTNTYNVGDVVGASDSTDITNYFYALIVEVVADVLTCVVKSVGGTGSISDWVTIKAEGLLIEEQRTNLLLWSEALDNTAWSKFVGTTVTADSDIAPTGSATADRVALSTDLNSRLEQTVSVTVGAVYTFSAWLRAVGSTPQTVRFELGAANGRVDVEVSQTWQRVYVTGAATQSNVFPKIQSLGEAVEINLWGAQIEQAESPSSYIKTEGTQVTRTAANCTRTLGAEFNPNVGTIFFDGVIKDMPPVGIFLTLGDVVSLRTTQFVRRSNGNISAQIVLNSGTSVLGVEVAYSHGARYAMALSWSPNGWVSCVNGVTATGLDVNLSPNPGSLKLSDAPEVVRGVVNANQIRYIPRALSEAELIALTTPEA